MAQEKAYCMYVNITSHKADFSNIIIYCTLQYLCLLYDLSHSTQKNKKNLVFIGAAIFNFFKIFAKRIHFRRRIMNKFVTNFCPRINYELFL